jgi:hypothetical protein
MTTPTTRSPSSGLEFVKLTDFEPRRDSSTPCVILPGSKDEAVDDSWVLLSASGSISTRRPEVLTRISSDASRAAKGRSEHKVEELIRTRGLTSLEALERIPFAVELESEKAALERLMTNIELDETACGRALCIIAKLGESKHLSTILRKKEELQLADRDEAVRICLAAGHLDLATTYLNHFVVSEEVYVEALKAGSSEGNKKLVNAVLRQAETSPEQRGSALTLATKNNHGEIAQLILEKGVDKKGRGKSLCFASSNNMIALVNELLKGEPLEIKYYNSALASAVKGLYIEIYLAIWNTKLIEKTVVIELLPEIVSMDHPEILEKFLKIRLDDGHFIEAIFTAIVLNKTNSFRMLLRKFHESKKFLGDLLVETTKRNRIEMVKLLLDLNKIEYAQTKDALEKAAEGRFYEVFRMILNYMKSKEMPLLYCLIDTIVTSVISADMGKEATGGGARAEPRHEIMVVPSHPKMIIDVLDCCIQTRTEDEGKIEMPIFNDALMFAINSFDEKLAKMIIDHCEITEHTRIKCRAMAEANGLKEVVEKLKTPEEASSEYRIVSFAKGLKKAIWG